MPLRLEEALASLAGSSGLGKEFAVECILIDDGSVPEISLPIHAFEENTDIHFEHIQIGHGGKSAALNEGLQLAKGEYITFLDADDILPAESLSKRLKIAQETNADMVIGGFETFDESGMLNYRKAPDKSSEELIHSLLYAIKSPIHLNSMLIKRSLLAEVGAFDEQLLRGQDKDYAIRLLKHTDNIQVIDQSVYRYRRYSRGWGRQLANRLTTMRCKGRIINKHTKGFQWFICQGWGWSIEVLKLFYEMIFGVYKK
ncbi:MAG: glycosyltransferase [Balneolaceae bacterium]|nr:glycosyltransferase [Balneolaceae bacterium]